MTLGAVAALTVTGSAVAASEYSGFTNDTSPAEMSASQPNPFNLSGPMPGRHSDFGVPAIEGEPSETTIDDLKRELPRAGVLAASDAAEFDRARAFHLRRDDGKFHATAEYEREDAVIRIESWVPDSSFTLFAPLESPVQDIQQTTIDGRNAVTILPTEAVVGNPPRHVYVEVDGVWYSVLGEGLTSNQALLDIVQRMVEEVSS